MPSPEQTRARQFGLRFGPRRYKWMGGPRPWTEAQRRWRMRWRARLRSWRSLRRAPVASTQTQTHEPIRRSRQPKLPVRIVFKPREATPEQAAAAADRVVDALAILLDDPS